MTGQLASASTISTDLTNNTNTTLVPGSSVDVVVAKGYSAAGDGGGGTFYWDNTLNVADGGTKIMPIGSTFGGWRRIFDGPLNVRWFGARGDKVTDDSPAFAKALSALGPVGSLVAGTVVVPKGDYRLTEDLVLNREINLRGESGSGRSSASKLIFADGRGITVEMPGGQSSVIQDLYIRMNPADRPQAESPRPVRHGIHVQIVATIHRCCVIGFSGHGIHIDGSNSSGTPPVDYFVHQWRVSQCWIENNEGLGVLRSRRLYCRSGRQFEMHQQWARRDLGLVQGGEHVHRMHG